MVIKGRSRSNGPQLADYLLQNKQNDRAQILEVRGTAQPENLRQSLFEMSVSSELTKRGKLGLYHAQMNPAIGEDRPMTPEDWLTAADILEKNLGYEGQKRAIILHEKNGRVHGHIVWERYDDTTGKLLSDSKNFKQHDKARAEIEQQLGHERTPQKAQREPTDKERLTQLWQEHPDGRGFVEAAQTAGYSVAQGNARRPFRVVTPDGQSLDLTRQLDGIKTKEVRDRLQPIRADLLTEAEALQRMNESREQAQPEIAPVEKSDKLRDLSDSQSLALSMINRRKEQEAKPEQRQFASYSFTINQQLNMPTPLEYSEILAQQEKALVKADQDYEVARERIKQMQAGHYKPEQFDLELERLEKLHDKQVAELQQKNEGLKQEILGEAPALPRQPVEKTWSDNSQKLSDSQDRAAAMINQQRTKQPDRENKTQEAQQQAKDQTRPANDSQPQHYINPVTGQEMTAAAYQKLQEFLERQKQREQEQQARKRDRGRDGPEY